VMRPAGIIPSITTVMYERGIEIDTAIFAS
jgi:hypothetical protein